MGKLRWIRSNYSKSIWILACVLLFGLTGQVAASGGVYESILKWDGDTVGSCVAVLDRMGTGGSDLEMICGHDLADETVIASIWKRSGEDLILVSYFGPVGNPFNATATLSETDLDELMLGNLFIAVSPTSREAEPVLGQIGVMDTGDNWVITEMEKDGHMDGWCASTIGRLGQRYQIGCYTPNNPAGGSVMVGDDMVFPLMGTTTLHAQVMPAHLAEPCTDGVDWTEFATALNLGLASVAVGEVGANIPMPMVVGDFATFADGLGGSYTTDIVLVNRHTTTDRNGHYIIRNPAGYPVQTEMFGPVAPLETVEAKSTGDAQDLFVGTVTVKADGPLGGVLRYNTPDGSAGVLASVPLVRSLVPVIKTATVSTGIAIRNPNSHDLMVEIRLIPPAADRSAVDDYIALGTVTLPPAGQVSKAIDELVDYTVPEGFVGTAVMIGKNGPVEAVSFEFGPGLFSVIPVGSVVGP